MPPQFNLYAIGSLLVALLSPVGFAFDGAGTIIGVLLGLLAFALGAVAVREISIGGSSARGLSLAVLGMLIGGLLIFLYAYKFTATGCGPMNTVRGMYEKAGEMPE